ncbi:hypothetical protein Tco_1204365 [Tanacetum coccineum]
MTPIPLRSILEAVILVSRAKVIENQAPSSPDYVPGPKDPPLSEFVPGSVYPEFIPPKDDVLSAEEQPLPTVVLPTADSPGYVPESDPEEDLEEDDDEDPEEDPADYPIDRDDDDEEEEDEDGEEEEAHPALADSVPPPIHRAPSTSHSLPLPPPIKISRTRSDAPPSGTPPILPIPLPSSSPSFLLPSTDHGADKPKVCLPPWKRLCFAFGPRYEVEESSFAPVTRSTGGFRADYGFIATLDREIRRDPERELGRRMTNFVTTVRQDTDEIYVRLGEAHDEREAKLSHESWGRSMDASDLARSEVMALRTQVVAQQSKIASLRAADYAQ